MANEKKDVLLLGPQRPVIVDGLAKAVHILLPPDSKTAAKEYEKFMAEVAPSVQAIAVSSTSERVDSRLMARFPQLKIVASFGVGYDHIDAAWAADSGIVVTHTPDVLNEEVADTAIGLLLCVVREFTQAERYLREGKWKQEAYPLSKASLRNRTAGIVGLGRIGRAIARRLDAMQVPVAYHSRRRAADVSYSYYSKLIEMAADVDVLMVITPGGPETKGLINRDVLKALGPSGILINVARGSVVDEEALIEALQEKVIMSAGLDVYAKQPDVPAELIAMDHVVLFPYLGSASTATREKMDELVVDNILAWAAGKPPLTPVPETPAPTA